MKQIRVTVGDTIGFEFKKLIDPLQLFNWDNKSQKALAAEGLSHDKTHPLNQQDPSGQSNRHIFNYSGGIIDALTRIGVPKNIAVMAAAQVAFETNNFTSRVLKKDGNYSGIKFVNKPYQDATRGEKSPEGDYYAKYKDNKGWAKDFKRIISLGGKNAPIYATDVADYVHRLKLNGYFGAPESQYYNGIMSMLKKMDSLSKDDNYEHQIVDAAMQETQDTQPGKMFTKKWWDDRSLLEKGGMVVGGSLAALIILKSTMK